MQPPLFTDAIAETWPAEPPSVRGSATSVAAAKAIESKAGRDRLRVFEFIRDRGEHGATDLEMQAELELTGDSQRPRRWELANEKLIVKSGEKRRTPAGNLSVVWIISPPIPEVPHA